MNTFTVPGMSCGGCAGKIKAALMQLDANADVEIDLTNKHVKVSSNHQERELIEAIEKAGYEVRKTPT